MSHTEAQKRASRIARGLPPNKPRSKGHAKRSKGHSRAAFAQRSEKLDHPFIAWDGEGVTDANGKHRYTLFANSTGTYVEADSVGADAIFKLIMATAREHPGAVHVIFGGSYDITMWIREFERDDIARIIRNETKHTVITEVASRRYAIDYRPRKHFRLANFSGEEMFRQRGKKWELNTETRVTIWEVFGFFGSSFVKACESYGVSADLDAMQAMKLKRSTFRDDEREAIREYCLAECRALAQLMTKLHANLCGAGLFPTRWDGAGAVAAALLKRENVKAHIVPEPKHLIEPVACAFFGGRIELCRIGRAKRPIYNYDIASAYPAAAQHLPSMAGLWMRTQGTNLCNRGFTLSRIRWDFRGKEMPWYPLPFRNARDGTITFPNEGEGWYWGPELHAALAWAAKMEYAPGSVRVLDQWTLFPETSEPVRPFAFIPQLFEQRKIMKREGNGAQMAVKLALNSLYGKTAQQMGAEPGKPPPYYSLPWAGWITSATRARLVEAGMTDPHAVVAFATDGIYSLRPLPLKTGDDLGNWEGPSMSDDAVFVAAGIYWTKHGKEWNSRYRGFDREPMATPDFVLDAWARKERETKVPSTRFVTHKSALMSAMLWEAVASWRTIDRAFRIDGKSPKRERIPEMKKRGEYALGSRLVPCAPRGNWDFEARQGISAPYDTFRLAELDGTDEETFNQETEETWL